MFADDEFGEKTVSVLLDGEETEMIFIDHPSTEMSVSMRHENNTINIQLKITLVFILNSLCLQGFGLYVNIKRLKYSKG